MQTCSFQSNFISWDVDVVSFDGHAIHPPPLGLIFEDETENSSINLLFMKRIIHLIYLLTTLQLLMSCENKYYTDVVAIDMIDTSGIYFTYEYFGEKYSGHFDLYAIEEDFSTSDSLKIRIDKKQPEKFNFVSIIKRTWEPEESIIIINRDNLNENQPIYSYHSVERKPLFEGAVDEFDNDSLIFDFFKSNLKLSDKIKKVGVYLLINEKGKISIQNAYYDKESELEIIRNLIDKMPDFSAPYHNGKNVSVSYLIEVPLND
ncbi:MAG: hypothetical protein HPY60_11815 [Candidatus Methanofastidiosum sp.]|nr:hypothetical protein [Methanofastidiosum sp.]